MIDAKEVADRVAHVRSEISNAGGSEVSLIAVTKSLMPHGRLMARSRIFLYLA
jgi:hypothetical protein